MHTFLAATVTSRQIFTIIFFIVGFILALLSAFWAGEGTRVRRPNLLALAIAAGFLAFIVVYWPN